MNDAREGMHSGPWHETREKRTPWAANASSDGVRALASPAQPIMSARCWSDMTSRMLGAPVVMLLPFPSDRMLVGGRTVAIIA